MFVWNEPNRFSVKACLRPPFQSWVCHREPRGKSLLDVELNSEIKTRSVSLMRSNWDHYSESVQTEINVSPSGPQTQPPGTPPWTPKTQQEPLECLSFTNTSSSYLPFKAWSVVSGETAHSSNKLTTRLTLPRHIQLSINPHLVPMFIPAAVVVGVALQRAGSAGQSHANESVVVAERGVR